MKFSKHTLVCLILLITSTAFAQLQFEAKSDIEELNDKVFIVTEINDTNFSFSDAIMVKYKLYVSHDTGIENWKEAYEPIYKDFKVNNSKLDNLEIISENYNGREYRTVTFKEVVLKSNRKGDLVLPEYTLNLKISVPSKEKKKTYDEFGRPLLEKRDISIKTEKINLTVK